MKKKVSVVILIFILIISVTGCEGAIKDKIDKSYDTKQIDKEIVERNVEFAFDIFKELNKEDAYENIFISPLSISTALSMTYNGAAGETKEDMAEALKYGGIDIEKINNTYNNLLPYLMQADEKVEIDISNSIWYRQGESIKEDFINTNKDIFDAKVEELDFSREDSADIINEWIKESTKGKIDKMIDPPISSDVIMYLINAVYFKGEWTEQFSEENTFDSEFNNIDGEIENLEMMNRRGTVDYGEGEDYKAVKLPYGDEKMSMLFILPQGDWTINDLIDEMDNDKFNEIRESISETNDVTLSIPKYKLEYGIKNLNKALISMGMGSAFSLDADFSGIRDNIFISRVLHKAVIEVNEEGSEAAAVTVVEIMETAIMEPIEFIADRPFLFIIMDEETNTVLFLGKYCRI